MYLLWNIFHLIKIKIYVFSSSHLNIILILKEAEPQFIWVGHFEVAYLLSGLFSC